MGWLSSWLGSRQVASGLLLMLLDYQGGEKGGRGSTWSHFWDV